MSDRVRAAAEFAQAHTAEGFTDADLADTLGCAVGTARRVRRALQRQLEDSPSQLVDLALATDRRERPGSPPGWRRLRPVESDHGRHDVHLYRLGARS